MGMMHDYLSQEMHVSLSHWLQGPSKNDGPAGPDNSANLPKDQNESTEATAPDMVSATDICSGHLAVIIVWNVAADS